MTYIEELQHVIKQLHGVESRHVESVPVEEICRNRIVRQEIVEVFELIGHPKASRIYAWTPDTDSNCPLRRHVTVFHLGLVTSPRLAVQAWVIQEFTANESEA